MSQAYQKHQWAKTYQGKLTFFGVYQEYYEECAAGWKAESTRSQSDSAIENKILPNLPHHDLRAIDSYTKNDIESVLKVLKKQGQAAPGKLYVPYAPETLDRFEFLMRRVIEVASDHYLCQKITDEKTIRKNNVHQIHARLPKSLSCDQEKAIAKKLLNPSISGEQIGLLLMYALGLRNGEACAANYGDIKPMEGHPDCLELWIYKSTVNHSNKLKGSGKTRNADRIVPIPDHVVSVLKKRSATIYVSNSGVINIEDFPIACRGFNYTERCSSDDLTAAAKNLFHTIHLPDDLLYDLNGEILNTKPLEDSPNGDILEKEPTAYLFRRNYGTHLHILGLTESEIAYIVGHDISHPRVSRNEFMSVEKRYIIHQKLSKRPLLNNARSNNHRITEEKNVMVCKAGTYIVPSNIRKVSVHASAIEPNTKLKVEVNATPQKMDLSVQAEIKHNDHFTAREIVQLCDEYISYYT